MAGIRVATIEYHHVPIVKKPDGQGETIGQMLDAELSTRVNRGELVQEVGVQFDMMDLNDVQMLREMYDPDAVRATVRRHK